MTKQYKADDLELGQTIVANNEDFRLTDIDYLLNGDMVLYLEKSKTERVTMRVRPGSPFTVRTR